MAGKHRKASRTTPLEPLPVPRPATAPDTSRHHRPDPLVPAPASPGRDADQPAAAPNGRHRKPGTAAIAWRTTGGVLVGAAVLGTAAVTAQASVLPFGGSSPAKSAAAADLTVARAPQKHAAGDAAAGRTGKAAPRQDAVPAPRAAAKAAPKQRAEKARPTAEAAIKLARSQIGESPDGDGDTKFGDWYEGTERAKETVARDGGSVQEYSDAEWCDMFISWVGDKLGFTDQIGSDAWTVAHARWFQDHDRWGDSPKPGAIVFFSWSGGKSNDDIQHVGMVVKDNGDGTIQTVEGNTGNSVKVKERSTDDVVGYGYPDYAG